MADITTGLQLHLEFEDGSGSSADDSSGNNNDGNLTGSPSWTTGKIGGGLDFDYTDGEDYVNIPNSASLEDVQEGDYTLSAWFNPGSTPPGTGSDNDAKYGILTKVGWHTGLHYDNNNKFGFDHILTGNVAENAISTNTFSPGQFYHVAGVVDKTAGTVKLYVDGNLEDTQNFTGGTAAKEYGTITWKVGIANPGGPTYAWPADGTVDDVRIYSRALDGDDITELARTAPISSPRGVKTAINGGSPLTSHDIDAPAHNEGDAIYIYASINGARQMNPPSGFSHVINSYKAYSNAVTMSLFRKVAGASEPSTYTWTSLSADYSVSMSWSIANDGGVDVVSAGNTGSSSTASCADATSTVDNALVLRLIATDNATLSHGTASGHTMIGSVESASAATISAQYEIEETAGAVGQVQPSLGASEEWGGRTVIIKPASGSPQGGGGGGGGGPVEYVRTAGAMGANFSLDIGTAGTDRLVTVHIGDEQAALIGITAVTVDGKSCTKLHDIVNTIGAGNAQQFWYITESTLGSSNGTVTVAFTGTWDTGHRAQAMLHTGVQDGAPHDSGYDNTSGAVGNITVTGIDCPANGVVIGGWGQGQNAPGTINSVTSPHTQRFLEVPSSATLAGTSGIESSGATNKTYVLDWVTTDGFRHTGIVASWAEAPASGWSAGEINGVTNLGKVNTVDAANIAKINTI